MDQIINSIQNILIDKVDNKLTFEEKRNIITQLVDEIHLEFQGEEQVNVKINGTLDTLVNDIVSSSQSLEVTNNKVHDNNNNIGIVLIGHEGVSPVAALDQARNGIVMVFTWMVGRKLSLSKIRAMKTTSVLKYLANMREKVQVKLQLETIQYLTIL